MTRHLLILILFPCQLFSQTSSNKTELANFKHPVKQLTDDNNYIDQKARMSIIEYLTSKHLDANKYYVDSSVSVYCDTVVIDIWDETGIMRINKIENTRDSLKNAGSKMKIPYPVGNPGNCFSAYFDTKSEKLVAVDIWQ